MTTNRDTDDRYEFEDEEEPRSVFSATWFRIVLATVGLGVVAAVALPYLPSGSPPVDKSPTATAPAPLLETKPATSLAPLPPPSPGGEGRSTSIVSVTPPSSSATAPPATAPDAARPGAAAPGVAKPGTTRSEPPTARTEPESVAAPAKKETTKPAAQLRRAASKPAVAKATPATRKAYWVQVGTFKDPEAAKRLAARLREEKLPVSSRPVATADAASQSGRLSRVRVGPFPDRAAATSALRQLETKGYRPFIARDA